METHTAVGANTCQAPRCGGFLDLHGCAQPWSCGILVCRRCGRETDEAGHPLPAVGKRVKVEAKPR